MNGLLQDLRYGLRALRRNPGLTTIAVLSLGLAIGANTTVFTWLNAFVLKPLPAVPAYSRLVAISARGPSDALWLLSYPALRDWREQSRSVDVASVSLAQLGMRAGQGDAVERTWGALVSGNYFSMLRITPAAGRMLTQRDETARAPVAVLGFNFWHSRFAGDSSVIGRVVTLNGHGVTVVGVAPPRFTGTYAGLLWDLYVPVTLQRQLIGSYSLDDRGSRWMEGIGRLKDGWTIAAANEELDLVARRLAEAEGERDERGAVVRPIAEATAAGPLTPVFLALLVVTGLVLLVACANVASLLLARAVARRREIGIRLALGASRGRLIRQLLTESLTLGLLAGAVGVLVAFWSRDALAALAPTPPFPIHFVFDMDPGVLGFALGVTLLTVVAFGLMPAVQSSAPDLIPALKDGIGGGPAQRSRVQQALVVGQVALSLVALVSAGLFLRSLDAVRRLEVGFTHPEQALLIATDLQLAGIPDSARPIVVRQLLERVRAVPGVTSASLMRKAPLCCAMVGRSMAVAVEGYTPRPDENMAVEYNNVGGDFFRAMQMPIVRGRGIADTDAAGAPDVAVVNERFAERFWPGQDPIGKRFEQFGRLRTVVGVAQQGKYNALTEDVTAMTYLPWAQAPVRGFEVIVRSDGDPTLLTAQLRRAFAQTSADLPFLDVRTLAGHIAVAAFVQRIGATMLSAFGAVALLLSAIGIYGIMAYTVSRRTREIGVRVALGAARRDVIGLVLGRAMRLAGLGLAIGLLAALGAGRLLGSLLLGVSGSDPLTFATIGILLGSVALLASWLPARRAAKVDPVLALRHE